MLGIYLSKREYIYVYIKIILNSLVTIIMHIHTFFHFLEYTEIFKKIKIRRLKGNLST